MEEKVCQESAAVNASPNNANAADAQARKKIFTIIYAVVLVAAFAGIVQLLYNTIDYFVHTPFYKSSSTVEELQIPLAVIMLFATLVSIAFVTLLVVSLCKKNSKTKLSCFVASIACVAALLIIVLACCGFWETRYKKINEANFNDPYVGNRYDKNLPYYVGGQSSQFALYSAVMAMLVPQLMYVAVLGALHVWDYVKTQKDKKAASQNVTAETTNAPIVEPEVTVSTLIDEPKVTTSTTDSEDAQ